MTNFSALPIVVAGILQRLRVVLPLTTPATAVYDAVPERPVYPYAALDLPFESPDRTFGQDGSSCTVMLSVYTQTPATTKAGAGPVGFAQGLAIAQAIVASLIDLDRDPLTLDGYDVVDVDVLSVAAFRETDGLTRRVDIMLALTLEEQLAT